MLEKIKHPGDIKKIDPSQYDRLAKEIRQFLIEKVSVTGGHLASNLGIVELTMAMHLVFDFTKDKVVWDVGHQSYVHKILTGRKDEFDTLRQFHGLSGFPKRRESETDCFDTGHSSNSVSVGLGLVAARDLKGEDNYIISVLGDGAATGGMFYEALNNAGRLKTNFIIVLNDNEMSIAPNRSGLACYLSSLRTATSYNDLKQQVKKKLTRVPNVGDTIVQHIDSMKNSIKQLFIPEMLFENFGVTYLGPIDGHNVQQMVRTFKEAKRMQKAVLIHVVTVKGKGYSYAERMPDKYHGVGPFDIRTGQPKNKAKVQTWTDVFSEALVKEAKVCPSLTAITAAMPDGTGLKKFAIEFPKRFFDVGIAEEHAVTFAAGQAAGGLVPVVAVYSSFLQRAYDQILEDVCLQNLHVVFAIDRAGIVGADGPTHQGLFDLSFLAEMPNMTIIAPKNGRELKDALHWAIHECKGPVAIRYGRGACPKEFSDIEKTFLDTRSEKLRTGRDSTLFAVGSMNSIALEICDILEKKYGISMRLINVRFLKPIDTWSLEKYALRGPIVTLEEGERTGGFGERAAAYLTERIPNVRIKIMAVNDQFVEQGTPDELRKMLRLSQEEAAEDIAAFLKQSSSDKN
jgi:1-deoxy-D-xylulose-5-phosphate synthase